MYTKRLHEYRMNSVIQVAQEFDRRVDIGKERNVRRRRSYEQKDDDTTRDPTRANRKRTMNSLIDQSTMNRDRTMAVDLAMYIHRRYSLLSIFLLIDALTTIEREFRYMSNDIQQLNRFDREVSFEIDRISYLKQTSVPIHGIQSVIVHY
jgi:hypothetical protein